jgi:hypothetical protein
LVHALPFTIAIRLLDDANQQVNRLTVESTKPSFLVKLFDEAMKMVFTNDHNDEVTFNVAGANSRVDIPANEKVLITNHFNTSPIMNGKLEIDKWDVTPFKGSKSNGSKIVNGYHKANDITSPTTLKDQLHNGNENNHQVVHANGTTHTRPKQLQQQYQWSEIPQILIDTAASVILAILNMHISDSATVHSIRNDARVLLRRLIRSGKVSARSHLTFMPTSDRNIVSDVTSFTQILQSLELSSGEQDNGQVWSAYTPFDFICDMFQYCSDVSERHMAIAIRYTLFNTRPIDIASYFVRNKNLTDCNNLRKQGSHIMLLLKKSKDVIEHAPTSTDDNNALLQHKMVISGTAYLIYRITNYSIGYNMALLRNAFENELDPTEFHILLQLAIQIISTPEKVKVHSPRNISQKSILQFVATLCDCIQRYNETIGNDNEQKNILGRIQNSLTTLSSATRKLLSLQRLVHESMDYIVRNNDFDTEQPQQPIETNPQQQLANANDRKKSSTTAIPPYQIERLIL